MNRYTSKLAVTRGSSGSERATARELMNALINMTTGLALTTRP
jgi:hypothetical protein